MKVNRGHCLWSRQSSAKLLPLRKLNKEWKRELTETGVDYFHAQEHWNLQSKAYHGLGTKGRDKLLDRLVCHLHHRFLFGASTIVEESDYRKNTTDRFRSQYGSPYGWAFQILMVMILLKLIEQKRQYQPVNILVEAGHPNALQAMGFIEKKKRLNRNKGLRVGTYGFGGKKDNPILQAADLLAFGIFRVSRERCLGFCFAPCA